MNPKKIYLAAGGAAGGSHWWEPQPVRRENGAADGGAADSGEYFLVDFGKKLGLQSKKNKFDADDLLTWMADVDSKEYFGK